MRYVHILFIIVICIQFGAAQDYKVSVYEDNYVELDTFESIILIDGNHLGWEKRFDLDFIFPYYDTTFDYISGQYESLFSFDGEWIILLD